MIDLIGKIFNRRKSERVTKYSGFSDFLLRASPEEKKRIFTKAAQKANEDQSKVFSDAEFKIS